MNHDLIADFQDSTARGGNSDFFRDLGATEAAISISKLEKVQEHILKLLRLEDNWDGEGAPPIHPDLIRSALHLTEQLMDDGGKAPQDVYPLPDGNIILEWQHPGGIIQRIEIEEVGRGEIMVTYPNAPAEFAKMTWLPRAPTGDAEAASPPGQVAPKTTMATLWEKDEFADLSECENFQLSA